MRATHHRATLSNVPTALIETLYCTLSLEPAHANQRSGQTEMVEAIRTALDARRPHCCQANLLSAGLNGPGFC